MFPDISVLTNILFTIPFVSLHFILIAELRFLRHKSGFVDQTPHSSNGQKKGGNFEWEGGDFD